MKLKQLVLQCLFHAVLADDETFDLNISQHPNEIHIFLRSGDSFSRTVEWRARNWDLMFKLIAKHPDGCDYVESNETERMEDREGRKDH